MRVQQQSNSLTLITSAARTATFNSGTANKKGYKGAIFCLNVSARAGTTPTLDVKLQGYDPASASWYDLTGAAFAQQTAVSTAPIDLLVYPGTVESANRKSSQILPDTFRAVCTIGGTTPSFTFTLGYTLLP